MYWLDPYRIAEIHRETYAVILKSWVSHGKRDEFARLCGITREYFSCLCALDGQLEGIVPIHKRYPSPHVARKIVKALSAPGEIKRSLLESMKLAHMNSAGLTLLLVQESWLRSLIRHEKIKQASISPEGKSNVFPVCLKLVHFIEYFSLEGKQI